MTLTHTIDTIISDAIEREIFPGAVVLIAQARRLLHHAAYGTMTYSAAGTGVVTRDTIYDIASLTKVFTATAALQLIDAGELALHTAVSHYLPRLRATDVTVFHLLTHTSGLNIRLSSLRHLTRTELLEAVYAAPQADPPGTRVAYTNVNALLLGELVAHLCGEPLDAALDRLVLTPLALRDTCFRPAAQVRERIAPTEVDHEWRGSLVHGSVHDESAYALGGVAGHAGLFSTTTDIYRFCESWLAIPRQQGAAVPASPLRLRADTAALALSNHTTGLDIACGLGWMLDRPNFMGGAPPGSFGHTGFTGPAMVVVPALDLIVVVLSNRIHPRRSPPRHHAITAALVDAAMHYVRLDTP